MSYARLHAANTPILTAWRAGAGLPGADRGHVLSLGGQSVRPTELQRRNALEADASGYSLTLPAAAKGLAYGFANIGSASISIYALGALPFHGAVHLDTIDGQPNDVPYTIEAGASVTFTCEANGHWVTA